jgi:mannose-1-phosphate guanylyltransferase
MLEEIQRFVPEIYKGVEKFVTRGKMSYFRRVPDISIDYGVMEKSSRLCVVEGDFQWDDVGSWLALDRYFGKDREVNILIGNARGIGLRDSIMYSQEVPLRAYDIEGLIIVVSKHGVLVCKKERAQELKKLFK